MYGYPVPNITYPKVKNYHLASNGLHQPRRGPEKEDLFLTRYHSDLQNKIRIFCENHCKPP